MAEKDNGRRKRGKVLDLNTKILISIRDELKEHGSILHVHTSILQQHTSILHDHSNRIEAVEKAVIDLTREMRNWVAHFDRDFLRRANDMDTIRARVEKCEQKLSLQ